MGLSTARSPRHPSWHRPGQPWEEAATVCLSKALRAGGHDTPLTSPPSHLPGVRKDSLSGHVQPLFNPSALSPWPQSTCMVDSDPLPPHTFSYRIQVFQTSRLAGFYLPLRPCPCDDSLDLLNPKTPFQSPQHNNASSSSARYFGSTHQHVPPLNTRKGSCGFRFRDDSLGLWKPRVRSH